MKQFLETIQTTRNGTAVLLPSTTVTVYEDDGTTLATIYADEEETPKTNPFTTGADAVVSYWAAPGRYKTTISKAGYPTTTIWRTLWEAVDADAAAIIGLTPKSAGEWTESAGTVGERLSHEFYVSDRIPGSGRVGRANPNRDATWNNDAWADAIDFCEEEGKTLRWTGIYQLTQPQSMSMAGKATFAVDRPSILGHGPGQSAIYYTGSADTYALTLTGPNWDSDEVPYTNSQQFGNFLLRCRNPLISDAANVATRNGLKIERAIGLELLPVSVLEAKLGVEFIDMVHLHGGLLDVGFCAYGIKATRSTHLGIDNFGSPVNEVRLRVKVHSSRQWGMDLYDINNWGLTGSIENTARPGSWTPEADQFGLRVTDGGYNGGQILELSGGFHFESSGGDADVIIVHGSRPGSYILAADFVRNGSTVYPTNNVLFYTTAASDSLLEVMQCSFQGVNGYVPNSGRRYVVHSGDTSKHTFNDFGAYYESATEAPVYQGAGLREKSSVHAWLLVNFPSAPTPNAANGHNFKTFTRTGTGAYTWEFASKMATSTFMTQAEHYPAISSSPQLRMRPISRTDQSISFQMVDGSGTATDLATNDELQLRAMYG